MLRLIPFAATVTIFRRRLAVIFVAFSPRLLLYRLMFYRRWCAISILLFFFFVPRAALPTPCWFISRDACFIIFTLPFSFIAADAAFALRWYPALSLMFRRCCCSYATSYFVFIFSHAWFWYSPPRLLMLCRCDAFVSLSLFSFAAALATLSLHWCHFYYLMSMPPLMPAATFSPAPRYAMMLPIFIMI